MDNITACDNARNYAESKLLAIAHFTQITLAIVCLFSIALNAPLKFCKYKSFALHKNLKIIIINAVILYIIHSFSVLVLQINNQVKYHTYTDPCDLLIEYWKCLIIKEGIHFAMIGFTLFHVILCFERSMAVLTPIRYEAAGISYGIISTILMWGVIVGWNLWMFIGEDFSVKFEYCILTTPTNAYKWTIEYASLMVVDIIVLIIDIIITVVNRKSLKRHLVQANFSQKFLGKAYQLNENARAMSIILPISIAHSIVFILFLSSTVAVRIFFKNLDPVLFKGLVECANTLVCVYTVVIPLVYFRLRKNLSPRITQIVPKGLNETEMYFKMLQNAIN